MIKKIVKATVIGLGISAMALTANAADIEINLYGASAQYKFWSAAAKTFLEDEKGSTNVTQLEDYKGKHGMTAGTTDDGTTVIIRYSSKASYDGIYACKGETPPGGQPNCSSYGPNYRLMAVGDADSDGYIDSGESDDTNDNNEANEMACMKVTIGASDVNGNTFGQTSSGGEEGCGSTSQSRTVTAIDTSMFSTSEIFRPVVVPFAFFANEDLQMGQTEADAPHLYNLTRLQALLIFSGQAWNWNDFSYQGTRYPVAWIVACLRHAGSGTHATLNAAVMRGDAPLLTSEDCPYIQFNDGSSDMIACVDANGFDSSGNAQGQNSGYIAVGYADADKNDGKTNNVYRMNYNGAEAIKTNIVNGVYSFWSHQWLFDCTNAGDDEKAWVAELGNYAKDEDNLPSGKSGYWAAEDEMVYVTKDSDFAMPSMIQPHAGY